MRSLRSLIRVVDHDTYQSLSTPIVRSTLIFILLLAAFLRLYRLGGYPPLNVDEAAIGYNAWSLIQTGKDEHGNSWPLHFKSFGDYKPGGYFYLVLPLVKFLDLNEWAIRLPSALMGVATVYLVYLLAKMLWQDEVLGLIWAFILSVSPWHIHFSRGGWESNAALFFTLLATYHFFRAEKEETRAITIHYSLFTIHSLLAMYTYHSARLVVPALVLGLAAFNRNFLWKRRKELVAPVFISFLLVIPLAISFLKGGASARFSGVGLLADPGPLWRVNELIGQHQKPALARLIHNKPIIYSIAFFQKYLSHFNGRFLFVDGDEVPRSKVPEMGTMYLFEFWFLALGFWFWLKKKIDHKYLPILWLLVAPLASAMTFQAPSALRALPMVIPLTFFVAQGIKQILKFKFKLKLKFKEVESEKLKLKLLALKYTQFIIQYSKYGILALYLWGIAYWWNQYFVHYLKRYPSAWPDFRPVAQWLKTNGDQYQKICIQGKYDQPYILTLFYLRYPPEKIQREIKLTSPDKFGFSTVKHFGKYWFSDCEQDMFVLGIENDE